jgi:4-carboxymuconolactone decarboxylase
MTSIRYLRSLHGNASGGDVPDMKAAYNFTRELRGLVPGSHKIWLANPQLSKTIVPTGHYYQRESTLTKAEIEIATNLINGRWRSAYANYEHEIIGVQQGGLAPEKVQALIAGRQTSFDDPRQQVVYELTSALVAARVVPMGLYRRAKAAAGRRGDCRRHRPVGVVHRRVHDPGRLRRACQCSRPRPMTAIADWSKHHVR